jgi:hypothetical protein
VHAGDIFPGDDLPLLDAKRGGSALAIGQTLENASRTIKGVSLVITGHGTERTWAELQDYLAFTNRFVDDVWRATQDRKSVDDIVRDWSIPAGYEKYAPVDADRLKNNVALAYKELRDEARAYAFGRNYAVSESYIGSRSATDAAPAPIAPTPTSTPEPSAPAPAPAPSEGSP